MATQEQIDEAVEAVREGHAALVAAIGTPTEPEMREQFRIAFEGLLLLRGEDG